MMPVNPSPRPPPRDGEGVKSSVDSPSPRRGGLGSGCPEAKEQPVKILAISDLYVPAHVMADALSVLNPTHLEIIEWTARDEAELHHRVRQIEQFGPGAHSPP